jgi:hypothetical protein
VDGTVLLAPASGTGVVGGVATYNGFLAFNYDNPMFDGYDATLKIIPRAVELLDYTPGGADYDAEAAALDIGTGDEVHGESGDDTVYGMVGNDVLFGEGEDDDLIGGYGQDWIAGGTGQDGVLGDDGRIATSRNGTEDEPLYGVAGFANNELDLFIKTPGSIQTAVINVSGALKKTVNLTPFNLDPDTGFQDELYDPLFADDIVYGGLGDDFLHGGAGDDAMSGAEALASFYNHPLNPGDVLRYGGTNRAEEFAAYDEFNPLRRILVDEHGEFLEPTEDPSTGFEFLLNFAHEDTNAPLDTHSDGTGFTPVPTDGDDVLFGDLGNDWLVGGTGRDTAWGGWGNDLLHLDDNLDSTINGDDPRANDVPDTHPSYEDRAFGGAGRDILIGNTGGDRLIDWAGEFNSYLVPFAPFGNFTISRSIQPQLKQFLYDVSKSNGADPTRAADTGSDADRNGEPEGEIGLVQQQDFAWQEQTGAPDDTQPGNIPGGPRDVLRAANFNDGQADGFTPDSGVWNVINGRFEVQPESLGQDAVSVFYVDHLLPSYFEIAATINAGKPTAGLKSNAFLIFDYQSPTDFKFAGVNISLDKIQMGYRDATGWQVVVQTPAQVKPDTNYNLLLSLNGTTATLVIDGAQYFSYAFAPRIEDGFAFGPNRGMVGIGADNSISRIDNVAVQVLPPELTYAMTEAFDDAVLDLVLTPDVGTWQVNGARYEGSAAGSEDRAVSLIDLGLPDGLDTASILELAVTLNTASGGGVVFDYIDATRFKFAAVLAESDQLVIGHYTENQGWAIDAAATVSGGIDAAADYELVVSLNGTTVNVSLALTSSPENDVAVAGYVFNGVTVDGDFGLLARDDGAVSANASFDAVAVRTNDPAFEAQNLLAAAAPDEPVGSEEMLTEALLAPIVDEAILRLTEGWNLDETDVALLNSVTFDITDLAGLTLGSTSATAVQIDINAAGHGWFVDPTPSDDAEFGMWLDGDTRVADDTSPASGSMDLLTVVMHELGHVLGREHTGDDGLMAATLAAGTRETDTWEVADMIHPKGTVNALSLTGFTQPANGSLADKGDGCDAQLFCPTYVSRFLVTFEHIALRTSPLKPPSAHSDDAVHPLPVSF